MNEGSEADLLRRFLRSRDEHAFRALHRLHGGAMFLLAVRLTGRADDAEDVVQEAWLRIAGGSASFGERSSLRTWLCGIVVNCAREARRRRPFEDLETAHPLTQEAAPASVDLERIVRALPDGFRQVLVLHDIYGYTHDEIASMLGIETGTSKSQLARARQRVRDRLTEGR